MMSLITVQKLLSLNGKQVEIGYMNSHFSMFKISENLVVLVLEVSYSIVQ